MTEKVMVRVGSLIKGRIFSYEGEIYRIVGAESFYKYCQNVKTDEVTAMRFDTYVWANNG